MNTAAKDMTPTRFHGWDAFLTIGSFWTAAAIISAMCIVWAATMPPWEHRALYLILDVAGWIALVLSCLAARKQGKAFALRSGMTALSNSPFFTGLFPHVTMSGLNAKRDLPMRHYSTPAWVRQ